VWSKTPVDESRYGPFNHPDSREWSEQPYPAGMSFHNDDLVHHSPGVMATVRNLQVSGDLEVGLALFTSRRFALQITSS
jgi:hypothetical protein